MKSYSDSEAWESAAGGWIEEQGSRADHFVIAFSDVDYASDASQSIESAEVVG